MQLLRWTKSSHGDHRHKLWNTIFTLPSMHWEDNEQRHSWLPQKSHSHNTVAQVQIYKDEQLMLSVFFHCYMNVLGFVLKPLYLFIDETCSKENIWLVLQYCGSLSLHEFIMNHVMVWASCLHVFYRHAETFFLTILDDVQGEASTETWAWACDKMNTFIYLLVNTKTWIPWRDLH